MKKINWKLLGDITTIISMTAVLIGFIVMANKIHNIDEELKNMKNELMKENINLKLENQSLWELYYDNVSEYNGEYYE